MVPADWSDDCVLEAAARYDIARLKRLLNETIVIQTDSGPQTVKRYTVDDEAHYHACTPLVAALTPCKDEAKEIKQYEMVQFLLQRGACPYQRDKGKNYPLIQAAKIGALRVAALLLEAWPHAGLEEDEWEIPHVDVQDSTLRTALMHAAGSTRIENFYQEVAEISDSRMVLLLLLYNADCAKETKKGTGKTAEKFAANDEIKAILSDLHAFKKEHPEIIEEIEKIKQKARLDWNRIQIAQRGGIQRFLRERALHGLRL